MSDRINCRLCAFTTAKWVTKNGKRREGFKIMAKHFESDHPEEYQKIKEYARANSQGLEDDDDDITVGYF